jgi:nitroreductase
MVLTAQELGIGSCWIGWFSEKRVKEILKIPKEQEVIALLTLGYPKEDHIPHHKGRKSKDEIFKFL